MAYIHIQATPKVHLACVEPSKALCFSASVALHKGFASPGETCLS